MENIGSNKIAISVSINSSLWMFNSGYIAHMIAYLNLLTELIAIDDGYMRTDSGHQIPIKGLGYFRLLPILPDRTVSSSFCSKNLYISDLEGSFFSQHSTKSIENIDLEDKQKMLIRKKKDNSMVLIASKSSDKMFYIKSSQSQKASSPKIILPYKF
jgi:hypothetical protein